MNSNQKSARELAEELAGQFLELDRIEKEAKQKKDALKEEITALSNSVFADEFIDNKWELDNATIALAFNPHKVVDVRTDKALTPQERQAFAVTLQDKYCTVDLNVKEIQASAEHDKALKNALKIANIAIVQETRYDVKRAKK